MVQRLYNLKKLDEIAQGNQGFIRDMLVTFVENVTKDIGGIQSQKSKNNWTAIAETAHKLASNFAYLGANSLHALAADIEKSVLSDRNFTGVADKTDKLCDEGILLVSQLKKDFCIIDT
jgi:HPt (histidine-containing phosphotransfer) domain-containing protein